MSSTSSTEANAQDAIGKHADHYKSMGPALPEALVDLARHAPEAFDAYSAMRANLLKTQEQGAKLPLKYKHLIIAVLDVQRDEPIGMNNHIRAAMLAGCTAEEVTEAILLGIIVNGMPAWGKIGRKGAEFAHQFAREAKAGTQG
jgi:alkylhydroperoxidase/carboxymuconolactone decarboxylase family protein YurZ